MEQNEITKGGISKPTRRNRHKLKPRTPEEAAMKLTSLRQKRYRNRKVAGGGVRLSGILEPEVAKRLSRLAKVYGSKTEAIRVALLHLDELTDSCASQS